MSKLRDLSLSANDITRELVTVKEWSDAVFEIRSLSGAERGAVMAGASFPGTTEIDPALLYPVVIIATAHDPETGEKVYAPEDRDALNGKNATALETLGKVALRLSGLSETETKKIAGNSGETPSGDSASA